MLLLVPKIKAELAKHLDVDAVQVCSLAKLLDAKWVDASFGEKDGGPGGVNFEEWRAQKKEMSRRG
jgi:hypothetical protein